MSDPQARSNLQVKLRRLRAPLLVVAIAYLTYLISQSKDAISAMQTPNWLALSMSLALGVVATMLAGLAFFGLLKKYAIPGRLVDAQKAYLVSQVAKYIPGKVWALAYQALSLGGALRDNTKLVAVNIELALLSVLGGATLVVVALWWTSGNAVYLAALACTAVAITLIPRSQMLLNLIIRLGGNIDFSGVRGRENSVHFQPGITTAFAIFVYHGLALPMAAFAVLGCNPQDSFLLGALSAAGWVAGTLSIIFPAGIGIRELVMVSLGYGSGLFSVETVAAFAVLSRIWMILIDVFGASLSLVLRPTRLSNVEKP